MPVDERWPDAAHSVAAIRCALQKASYAALVVAQAMAFTIEVSRPGFPLAEQVEDWRKPPNIVLNERVATVWHSALRHAVFVHMLPRALGKGWNRMHAAEWKERESELNRLAGRCWFELEPKYRLPASPGEDSSDEQ